jgi:hypothetical protein
MTDRPTTDRPTTTDCLQRNSNTAAIGHGGVDAPLTICWKCGKTQPPLAAERSVAPLRLLTKVVNWQLSVSPIVVFFVAAAVRVSQPNNYS